MAEETEDKESKTEEPTPRRLEQALEKGQVINSREVTTFLMLLSFTIITIFAIPFIGNRIGIILKSLIENSANSSFTISAIGMIISGTFNKILIYIIPIFILLVITIIASFFVQRGQFIFTFEQLMPKAERISLSKGLERLFSTRSLVEFLKSLVKVVIVGTIIYYIIYDDIKIIPLLAQFSSGDITFALFKVVKDILINSCIFMFVVAALDYSYQRYEYFKNLKMSRQELKEEYKQSEGNPEVKSKQRSLMRDKVQKEMLGNVPKADVIITNPDHYSIAVQYNPETMTAPIVVAKGVDHLAFKIREIANEHDIPIVENPPVARALYLVELNKEIPLEQYEAVAKIISYVYKLKKKSI